MDSTAEVIIVGAGMAGLALAMQLGRQGRPVLILEKAAAPRDKVCGEGLMPLGVAALARVGLEPGELPGQNFLGLLYRSGRQETLLNFGAAAQGRGIRRTVLLEALQTAALGYSTVRLLQDEAIAPLREGGTIRGVRGRGGEYRGQVVVAADGVQSRFAHAAGLPMRPYGYRMGLRRHYRVPGGGTWDRVRIGLFAPHDVYLTPVGEDTVLATTMTTHAGYDAVKENYGDFLRASPFGGIFRDAEPVSEQMGWHHPLYAHRGHQGQGMLLVGDAGGSLDPCLGMGISLALLTAQYAREAVTAMLERPEERAQALNKYEAACQQLYRHYRIFDYIFRFMVLSKARGELLMWGMRHWPETADAILGAVAECNPWRGIPWRSLLFPGRRDRVGKG
ncbi:MAG: FAD-dependent monooxygenase [SAR324 cluster bacterium]|nr:FAD-dependent monooxygenase [SAR324 cluster bacterium]